MYQVYCDGQLLHDPRLQEYQLLSPSLSLELNKTGSFTFTQYPNHPMAGLVQKLKSIIEVKKAGLSSSGDGPFPVKRDFTASRTIPVRVSWLFCWTAASGPLKWRAG